jgi:hypothetical protein
LNFSTLSREMTPESPPARGTVIALGRTQFHVPQEVPGIPSMALRLALGTLIVPLLFLLLVAVVYG